MIIGILSLDVRVGSSNSLKDKRRVIKSLTTRIRNSFNVSISEVNCQDLWQRSELGVAFLTTDVRFAQSVLNRIVDFVERHRDITLIDSKIEII
ncbi:DUF503 domain-containing protein [Candidatus Aerophobetes bacterium]|jgi:hypothetical protein|uniref:DUF503 domain-containing protein n=1 Tax=Aerophobetes bacterium TaxID=2030807 RepID=A0A523W9T8_UNCAE|nr:MAG: DUF503 domain-containing protein [Candidatus Aerophobetes bacterium]